MKKAILPFVFILSILVSGCFSASEDSLVESRWKLVETRVSIGGPAEYVPAEAEEYIEFLNDSKVRKSNGWCGEGTQTEVSYSEDGTILTNCNNSGAMLFEMDGDHLILRNPNCIEACDYKYEQVKK